MTTSSLTMEIPTVTTENSLAVSAYHAALSQYVNSLLQSHSHSNTSSSSRLPSRSRSRSISRSQSPSPNNLRRRSTIKAFNQSNNIKNNDNSNGNNESLLDPNIRVETLVDGKIKPDLLEHENLEKIDQDQHQDQDITHRSGHECGGDGPKSSIATHRSVITTVTTEGSQVEVESSSLSTSEGNDTNRGRVRSRSKTIRPKELGEHDRSESYDHKRRLKFAKNRAQLDSKVNYWLQGVRDASPEGVEMSPDIPPEIPDPIPSPSIPHAVIHRSTIPSSTNVSTSKVATPITVKPSPLILYDDFPTKAEQHSPRFVPNALSPRSDFAFNIDHMPVPIPIPMGGKSTNPGSEIGYTKSGLNFSSNSSKATLKSHHHCNHNTGTSDKGTESSDNQQRDNKDEWLLTVLGQSDNWDIPCRIPPISENDSSTGIEKRRSRSPMRVMVSGEMPTPKPVAAGTSFWG
ncbi:hypothetical protein I204_04200 [Kwoniella mangroviensis CBS 8886]|nr:hypothetical protein I204_04200 [Kwoniella mangroviensis CBS 8886]